MLILVAFLSPLFAYFDQWDPPSLGDDTEMMVFALVLVFCLLLVVCRLIVLFAVPLTRFLLRAREREQGESTWSLIVPANHFIPLQSPSPLRI